MDPKASHIKRRVPVVVGAGVVSAALIGFVISLTTPNVEVDSTPPMSVALSSFAPLLPCGLAEIDWSEVAVVVTKAEHVRTGDLHLSMIRFEAHDMEGLIELQKRFSAWCSSDEMMVVDGESFQGVAWHGFDQGTTTYGMLTIQSGTEAIALIAVSHAS